MVSPNSDVQHEGRPGQMRKVSICGGEQMWVSGSMTPQRWPGSQGSAPASPAHGAEAPGELGHGAETRAGGRRLVCSLALQLVTHSETATRPPCHVICVEQPPPPTVTAGRPHGGHGRFASSQSGEDGGLVQRVSAPCRGHTVQGLPRAGHVGEDTENNSPASREHTVPDRRLRSAGGGALP